MSDVTHIARIIADDWERHVVATRFLGEAESGERPFVADWPALVRWRDRVLRDRRKYPPDVVAAACEALALECAISGHEDLKERALAEAERVVLGARPVERAG